MDGGHAMNSQNLQNSSKVVRVGRVNKARLDNLKKAYNFKSYAEVVAFLLNVRDAHLSEVK